MPVSSIQILKGIPYLGRRKQILRFPFEGMQPWDAFFTEEKSVSGYASEFGKKNGMKFATKSKYEYEGKQWYMCWRIS